MKREIPVTEEAKKRLSSIPEVTGAEVKGVGSFKMRVQHSCPERAHKVETHRLGRIQGQGNKDLPSVLS
jgi:hypothetical protein